MAKQTIEITGCTAPDTEVDQSFFGNKIRWRSKDYEYKVNFTNDQWPFKEKWGEENPIDVPKKDESNYLKLKKVKKDRTVEYFIASDETTCPSAGARIIIRK